MCKESESGNFTMKSSHAINCIGMERWLSEMASLHLVAVNGSYNLCETSERCSPVNESIRLK
jgi:hypothetical protein